MMKRQFFIITGIVTVCWTLPYVAGWLSAGDAWVFNGFLFNPIDGNSYLAKMQLGWMGEWRFTLPYTSQAGEGAYLFLFYITLGHFARLLSLPLIFVFHFARIIAGIFMAWTLWRFIIWVYKNQTSLVARTFAIVIFGSGMGWLFNPIVGLTSDMWVAEAYPFLSGLTNPHFPLGISLILWILIHSNRVMTWKVRIALLVEGLFLSIIMPFGIVVLAVILAGWVAWDWFGQRKLRVDIAIWPVLAGGSFLLYQFIAIQTDPVLYQWNAQNVTISPPWWDLLVSFSPAMILAIPSIWKLIKREKAQEWKVIIGWMILGGILIWIPYSLQRRFLLGFYIPTGILAVIYLGSLIPIKLKWFYPLLLILSIITNSVVLMASWFGIQTKSPHLFLSRNEADGLAWLATNIQERSLVLASPEIGNLIPALTPHHVIYGHPFETVNAEEEKRFVENLYQGGNNPENLLNQIESRKVDYIFYGPREQELGKAEIVGAFQIVYENADVKIFSVHP